MQVRFTISYPALVDGQVEIYNYRHLQQQPMGARHFVQVTNQTDNTYFIFIGWE